MNSQTDPEDWGTIPEYLRSAIDSSGKPRDTMNNVRPLPCPCGFEWDAMAFPYPHDICGHAGGEHIVVCPKCKLDGTLKATPWWAIRAWNELRSNDGLATSLDALRNALKQARDSIHFLACEDGECCSDCDAATQALAAATGTAKTAKQAECEASQSGPQGNAHTQGENPHG